MAQSPYVSQEYNLDNKNESNFVIDECASQIEREGPFCRRKAVTHKQRRFFLILLSGFGLALGVLWASRTVMAILAYRMVKDPNTSQSRFDSAIKTLEKYDGEPQFWLKLASDGRFPRERRRRFVRHYFNHFVPYSMRFDELSKSIGICPNWISYERIRKRGDVNGWLPDVMFTGQSAFFIPVLSDREDSYQMEIMMSFNKDLDETNVVDVFQGKLKTGDLADLIVVGCDTCDSEDLARRYGSARGWYP